MVFCAEVCGWGRCTIASCLVRWMSKGAMEHRANCAATASRAPQRTNAHHVAKFARTDGLIFGSRIKHAHFSLYSLKS